MSLKLSMDVLMLLATVVLRLVGNRLMMAGTLDDVRRLLLAKSKHLIHIIARLWVAQVLMIADGDVVVPLLERLAPRRSHCQGMEVWHFLVLKLWTRRLWWAGPSWMVHILPVADHAVCVASVIMKGLLLMRLLPDEGPRALTLIEGRSLLPMRSHHMRMLLGNSLLMLADVLLPWTALGILQITRRLPLAKVRPRQRSLARVVVLPSIVRRPSVPGTVLPLLVVRHAMQRWAEIRSW